MERGLGYLGARVKALTNYTCKLTAEQADKLRGILQERGYLEREVPYARFAAANDVVNVVFYESGKLVVQGKGTADLVQFILEPDILGEAKVGYEAVLDPEFYAARIGIDESGKGDFFGPLCVAGVYVNEKVIKVWAESGIRDSKSVSSDKKMAELADLIKKTEGCIYSVVPIGNEAYNRLQRKIGSVNGLLAWGHARVVENLLQKKSMLNPLPVRAISDQFASSKSTVAKAMMELGKGIELVQRHKAEADIAVAAASILARDEYVKRLAGMERLYGLKFPKGASAAVIEAGKEFVKKFGDEKLVQVAKMHFRTSYTVLGLPEPPKTEWRKPGQRQPEP